MTLRTAVESELRSALMDARSENNLLRAEVGRLRDENVELKKSYTDLYDKYSRGI